MSVTLTKTITAFPPDSLSIILQMSKPESAETAPLATDEMECMIRELTSASESELEERAKADQAVYKLMQEMIKSHQIIAEENKKLHERVISSESAKKETDAVHKREMQASEGKLLAKIAALQERLSITQTTLEQRDEALSFLKKLWDEDNLLPAVKWMYIGRTGEHVQQGSAAYVCSIERALGSTRWQNIKPRYSWDKCKTQICDKCLLQDNSTYPKKKE